MDNIEKRYCPVIDDIKFRAVTDEDGKRYLEGHAAVFNSRSKLISEWGELFYEEIERGAFTDVLDNPDLDVILAPNHNSMQVMARTTSGTLILSEDETGLFFRAEIPDISYANDVYVSVERGDLFENSFAFSVDSDGYTWTETEEQIPLRKISKVKRLVDVSVVTHGAYSETKVDARGLKEFVKSNDETEDKPTTDIDDIKLRLKLIKLKNNNY